MSEMGQTLLRKAATDHGFDIELEPVVAGDVTWLSFHSTRASTPLWLARGKLPGEALFALGDPVLASALDLRPQNQAPLPPNAVACFAVPDLSDLHPALRRVYQLGVSLPDGPLRRFQHMAASMPQQTEAERDVVVRVGQDIFRDSLLQYWQGRCAITGLDVPELLRASHIKPWAECDSDAERLDSFNGLLLAAHLDAAFDRGFITLDAQGAVVVSSSLGAKARTVLGLDQPLKVRLEARHERYLPWHRQRVFRG